MGNSRTAVIYARQSSGDDDVSVSVEVQLEMCRSLCRSRGWEVVGEFSDLNSSGRTYPEGGESMSAIDAVYQSWAAGQSRRPRHRPGLGALLRRECDAVVAYDLTRLMRPVTGSYLEPWLLQRLAGKTIVTVAGQASLDTMEGRLVATIASQVNDDQLRKSRERALASIAALRASGRRVSGRAPYGYRYSRDRGGLVATTELAEVRRAAAMLLDGETPTAICRALNASPSGRTWTLKKLHRTLALPVYGGLLRHRGRLIRMAEGELSEQALSEEAWHRVQELLSGRSMPKRQRTRTYALSGLLVCGYCGRSLRVVASTVFEGPGKPRGPAVHSYQCPDGQLRPETMLDCSLVRIRYALDEAALDDCPRAQPNSMDIHAARAHHARRAVSEMRPLGLYEAISPMLYAVALQDAIGVPDPALDADRDRLLEIDRLSAEAEAGRAEALSLRADNLISSDELRSALARLGVRLAELTDEREAILARIAAAEAGAGDRAMARLEAIRNARLHPADFRALFLRLFDGGVVFATKVVLRTRGGGDIVLPRVQEKSISGMPPYILDPGIPGERPTVVTFILKSKWVDIDDGFVGPFPNAREVFRDDRLVVFVAGKNPLPGESSGIARASARTKRRRELAEEEL